MKFFLNPFLFYQTPPALPLPFYPQPLLPPILVSVTNAIGRETVDGKGTWYLDPEFAHWYRIGGFLVLLVLIYLSEIFDSYLPLFV